MAIAYDGHLQYHISAICDTCVLVCWEPIGRLSDVYQKHDLGNQDPLDAVFVFFFCEISSHNRIVMAKTQKKRDNSLPEIHGQARRRSGRTTAPLNMPLFVQWS
jgi:hypothetical protein